MSTTNIREQIVQIISKVTNVPADEIADHHRLTVDLSMDSVQFIELVVRMEETMVLIISDAELAKYFDTIESITAFVSGKRE